MSTERRERDSSRGEDSRHLGHRARQKVGRLHDE